MQVPLLQIRADFIRRLNSIGTIDRLQILAYHKLTHGQPLGRGITNKQLTHQQWLKHVLLRCNQPHAILFLFPVCSLVEPHFPLLRLHPHLPDLGPLTQICLLNCPNIVQLLGLLGSLCCGWGTLLVDHINSFYRSLFGMLLLIEVADLALGLRFCWDSIGQINMICSASFVSIIRVDLRPIEIE